MKLAYLDCASGISGDMMLGALVDAGANLEQIQQGIDSLGLPGCRLVRTEVKRCGFRALHLVVEHQEETSHRHLHHIEKLIDGSRLNPRQQQLAKQIFLKLGEAEAKVHGTTLQKVHFHEVGAADSIADICGTAIGLDLLGIERVEASAIPTGWGSIKIAHGRCSIPAPATAELLTGVPLAASSVEAELTTPTGAAIVATLVERFGPPPAMKIERIGYGAGTRELTEQPNVLRLLCGQAMEAFAEREQTWLVETNLDDASGELVGYAAARLWSAGALDVWTTPIGMKKGRPGVRLTALCPSTAVEEVERVLFRETTTLGVRRWPVSRTILSRRCYEVETAWGKVAGVLAETPDGPRFSPEYEACRQIAESQGLPLPQVFAAARDAFGSSQA